MRFAVLSVSLALGFAAGYTAQRSERAVRLFVLERSTNLNVVAYDLRLAGSGVDLEDPIDAYWLLFEEGGEREELSRLERRLAFGVEVARAGAEEVVFTLAALPSRPITVRWGPRGPAPFVEIGGESARLTGVFVAAREGGLLPGVHYVELRGISERTGADALERIAP